MRHPLICIYHNLTLFIFLVSRNFHTFLIILVLYLLPSYTLLYIIYIQSNTVAPVPCHISCSLSLSILILHAVHNIVSVLEASHASASPSLMHA